MSPSVSFIKSWFLLFTVGQLTSINSFIVKNEPTFRAAVYEHTIVMPLECRLHKCSRSEALSYMHINLDIYEEQVQLAAEKGADIIVFPEDGLYGWIFTRSTLEPFLEYIPDPRLMEWNPCADPYRFGSNSDVMVRLSCLARNFKIYLAANVGDRQPCSLEDEDLQNGNCPENGAWFYNTDVLFDKRGTLIARYHKQHLFEGERFYWNFPAQVEYSFVDTSIGRLGFATCFDILFDEPAVKLVDNHGIDTLLFLTAWTNVLPLFPAIGFHSAWAHGMGVNVLSANARNASIQRTGSGIYSARGPVQFFHSDDPAQHGALLVADVPIGSSTKKSRHVPSRRKVPATRVEKLSPRFGSELFHDVFEFTILNNLSRPGKAAVCHNELCCEAEYEFSKASSVSSDVELFALGVYDGMHYAEGQYYLQICVVLKCASPNDYSSCGSPVSDSATTFDYLKLSGNHSTSYVFPEVTLSGPTLAPNQYMVQDGSLIFKNTTSAGLLTAALFGRVYERDSGL